MKTRLSSWFIVFAVVSPSSDGASSNSPVSYLIGGIIAIIIMGYLIYTLIHPEKF